MMRLISNLLEVLGVLAVVAAAWLTDLRLGIAVAGVFAVLVGFLMDRPGADR